MTLRLALIGGPMYDGLYELLEDRDVEIVVHADHPTLNRRVAELLDADERIDVVSTHAKYAPSQAQWLQPLDQLLAPGVVDALSPRAVDLCRVDGALLSVPRVIDVRILWVNAEQLATAPDTWDDVVRAAERGNPFGMPGRESGLFGTFFELVTGAGGRFLRDGVTVERDVAVSAVEQLVRIARAAPSDLPQWHYDQADAALLDGRVAAAAAWPGATARVRSSPLPLEPHPYPAGPEQRVTYSGCHSWAIPTTCGDLDAAIDLVTALCGIEAQTRDAAAGSVCAHVDAFAAVEPSDPIDDSRLALTRDAIESQMITYPSLQRFPEIEDPGWMALHDALVGRVTAVEAVDRIDAAIRTVLSTDQKESG